MNILLVDDDTAILKLIAKVIQNFGHNVVTAEDGQIGLEIFLKEPTFFHLIISDVMMPIIDGLELLRKVRQYSSEIPFIVTTGYNEIGIVIKALKQGATDFMSKPYSSKELSTALNKIESMLDTKSSIEKTLPFINTTFQTSMPSRTNLIPGLVGILKEVAKPYCQLYGINSADITTSLTEALTNAVVHGNLDIPSELKTISWESFQDMLEQRESMPEYVDRAVNVSFEVFNLNLETYDKEQNRTLLNVDNRTSPNVDNRTSPHVDNEKWDFKSGGKVMQMQWSIMDSGKGFDYNSLPDRLDPTKFLLSGRGMFLIRSFMDKVSWNSKGNAIQMVKYLKK
ncbi:MAG: response regulator [Desulfamplus sp.]|nr:response regulator [Desulfamplus sp.]